jgi:hypothetical protein
MLLDGKQTSLGLVWKEGLNVWRGGMCEIGIHELICERKLL